jgi:hypothetical protein
MRRSASTLAVLAVAATVTLSGPAPASAGVISTAGGILSGVGGTVLGIGKSVLCKGLSATGTVAKGAATVGGAAVGGASTEGAGTAEGAAAGSVVGGALKKGIGGVTKLVCSSGGGAGSTLLKTAVGAVAAAANVRSRRALAHRSGAEDHGRDRGDNHDVDLAAAHRELVSGVVRADGRARRGARVAGDADRAGLGGGAARPGRARGDVGGDPSGGARDGPADRADHVGVADL